MFNPKRFYAVLVARNLEFVRDYASLGWGLLFPVFIVIGFAFIFNGQQALYTLGTVGDGKVSILQAEGSVAGLKRLPVSGDALRYVDWALPGVLAMNIMFAALYGIGFVIVRYRKMGVLKRLLATPVSAVEFLSAQLVSRLMLILVVNTILFVGLWLTVDFRMEGSPLLLLLIFAIGSTSLIALGLLVAARISSEELANGLLNVATWPMMLLSEVWFSMADAAPWLQRVADALPLTHMTRSARAVMLDNAGFTDVLPSLLYLVGVTAALLVAGALLFRWET